MGADFVKVHSDERRVILANDTILDGKEVSIIELKRGKAIGGCLHNKDELMFILKGVVLCNFGDGWEVFSAGYGRIIKSDTPHAFMAPMDGCLIIESGLTKEEKENSIHDIKLQKEVIRINGKD